MPITLEPMSAYVLFHDNTWDYLCRECLQKGTDVRMISRKFGKIVFFIKCPKYGLTERIDTPQVK